MALQKQYKKGERYTFIASDERDAHGCQIMKDVQGRRHLLTGAMSRYKNGDKVRCKVIGYGKKPVGPITGNYLVLSEPRRVSELPPSLGRHKCGKPFTCNCCGKSFPANAGWRVDLRDIYFCNSCAKKVYEDKGRGNRHFIISTPMGNKR